MEDIKEKTADEMSKGKILKYLYKIYTDRVKFTVYTDKLGTHILGEIGYMNDFRYTFDHLICKGETLHRLEEITNKMILDGVRR